MTDLRIDGNYDIYDIYATDEVPPQDPPSGNGKKAPVFMDPHDVSTATAEEAKNLGEFLSNGRVRRERRKELSEYLLSNGLAKTEAEARRIARNQVRNERAQSRAKLTVTFIDRVQYQRFKDEQGPNGLYRAELITDPDVIKMIRGNKLINPTKEEREAHLKKFYKTDEEGNLVKDRHGEYIFDSDKYKAEMENDVTAFRLTLTDRENAAKKRGYEKSDERKAIKAAGLDVKIDKTWPVRGLAFLAALASLLWGGSTAIAEAHAHTDGPCDNDADAMAKARADSYVGNAVGFGTSMVTALTYKDRDAEVDNREKAKDIFQPDPEVKEEDPCEELKKENEELKKELEEKENCPPCPETEDPKAPPVINNEQPEEPCYSMQDGTTVKVIKFGGYWHYAQLYNDCTSGKRLTSAQVNELTELLKPGHPEASIQEDGSNRILQDRIKLKDGTEVCLADEVERQRRINSMKTVGGGGNMQMQERLITIRSCDGTEVYYAKSVKEAKEIMDRLKNQPKCN